ncbi:MAG: ATP-binding cassette domain-containing protein, partial [Deinococcus sp.]
MTVPSPSPHAGPAPEPQQQVPQLTASGLSKSYGRRRVVQGVDLRVARGEIVALFGPNGAGKTTTFYMMVGFIRPGGGVIRLSGQDVTRLPMHLRAQRGIGYLPQEPSAFRKMTARDNLLAILEFQKLSRLQQ